MRGLHRRRGRAAAAALGLAMALTACGPLQPWRSELVSVNAAGDSSGNGASVDAALSPDGTKAVFVSSADDLGPTDSNGAADVYLRDLASGTTTLVSVNAAGTDSADGMSFQAGFSSDGTKIVFVSLAGDLGPSDTNGQVDVYVRDLVAGTTSLVSVNAAGTDSGGRASSGGAFSADGTKVVFESQADLVPTDANGDGDVYLRDLVTGTTTLVSVNAAGVAGNAWSHDPGFSPDGTKVVFSSYADDLGPTDSGGEFGSQEDVYVRDLVTGTTSLVSVNAAGTDSGNNWSAIAVFSPDGTKVSFQSHASDLVATDTNTRRDVFVRDLVTGTTALVSVNAAGTDSGNREVSEFLPPLFSPDGTKIAFLTEADDLGPVDTNGGSPQPDVYLRDLPSGMTSVVSVGPGGNDTAPIRAKGPVAFSPDGNRIAFGAEVRGVGLTPVETRTVEQVYVRDLADRRTTLVPTDRTGSAAGNAGSHVAGGPLGTGTFSPDGRRLLYVSDASNLGPVDRARSVVPAGEEDVYVATLRGADLTIAGTVEPQSVEPGDTVTYRYEAGNLGPDPAEEVTFMAVAPAGAEAESTQGECQIGYALVIRVVTCELGDLPVSGQAEVTVRGTASAAAAPPAPFGGVRSLPTADPFHSNNTTFVTPTVAGP